ncbi:phage tail protein [Pseudomonas mosselii]|uniref:phage tail protein n=1 Tax=Pseudomonas mosselii TaxID=78327 RepID=UPI0029BFDB6E|nr:phage tail protein [Pseudomonas mosselii]
MVDQNSQFYAILTNVGAAKQANADALGIPWRITQMGVGDANGTDPTPNATQIALVNEWRRAPLNQLKVDDKDPSIIVAEQVIPADVGGRWIREIGLYDADGDLIAVANCAPTYKPLLSQGSGRTQVVRMNLIVSSSSSVQLKIDPSVVLATREWVTEELARQDFKHSAVAATTAAIVLSGLQTIDGVALEAGARVLVRNQAAAKDNGLYLVAAGPWVRCADADASAKVTPGLLVLIERGVANGDSAWQLVTDGPITLGVTGLAFEMAWGRTGVTAGTYRSVTVDRYGRVLAATNPTTVEGYGLTDVYTKTQVDQALAGKAPLASPDFTGIPKAPTAPAGTETTQVANTAFVVAAIRALISSAPGALDTLNELAAALGNDPNFAATMTNALAGKAGKATTLAGYGITDAQPWAKLLSDFVTNGGWGLGQKTPAYVMNANSAVTIGFYGAGGVGALNFADVYSPLLVLCRGEQVVAQLQYTQGNYLAWRGSYDGGATWTVWSTGLRFGDYGIGGQHVSTETDLNKYLGGGKYITPGSGLVGLPSGWAQGRHSVDVTGGASYCTQVITGLGANRGRIAIRTFDGAGWQEQELVTPSNQVSFGVGQTWQDVTASRTWGTNYPNSTGKPIMLAITVRDTAGGAGNLAARLYVGGIVVGNCYMVGGSQTTLYGVVPPGVLYQLQRDDTNDAIVTWAELRT